MWIGLMPIHAGVAVGIDMAGSAELREHIHKGPRYSLRGLFKLKKS